MQGITQSALDDEAAANRTASMTRHAQKPRTPEQIRAGNRRLGLILLVVAAAFFLGGVVKQVYFAGH
jgi:hypothetical protein